MFLNLMAAQSGRRGGFRLGGLRKRDSKSDIANAAALAQSADHVVLVIGTDAEWESEAYDRDDLKYVRFALLKW
jgi:beta-glucosidase